MKYLFTFAAVGEPIGQRIFAFPQKVQSTSSYENPSVRSIEGILYKSLNEQPNKIAFFRSVMDGWDATHRILSRWIATHRPRAEKNWQEFCDTGRLIHRPDSSVPLDLGGCPTASEISEVMDQYEIEAYAIRAFIDAIYDALEFAASTGTTFVAVGRCIGATLDDSEYR